MKDFYAVLGVLPTAEDVVIRAAYKALAQRYHPDKYKGRREEAETLMQQLNAAYAILSDPEKRRRYDETLKAENDRSYETEAESVEDDPLAEAMLVLEEDWQIACKFYPELQNTYVKLQKTNRTLASMFKVVLLEFKGFSNHAQIGEEMEYLFLTRYFGTDDAIIKFAKELIYAGNKKAAKALNKYVTVMGNGVRNVSIISRVRQEFNVPDPWVVAKQRAAAEAAEWAERENRLANEKRGKQQANEKRSKQQAEAKKGEEVRASMAHEGAGKLPYDEAGTRGDQYLMLGAAIILICGLAFVFPPILFIALPVIIAFFVISFVGSKNDAMTIDAICPHCSAKISSGSTKCPNCRTAFLGEYQPRRPLN